MKEKEDAFCEGERVRVIGGRFIGLVGTIYMVDRGPRRRDPYYIYYVQLDDVPGLVVVDYEDLERVRSGRW